jgi:hypothetical protein
VTWSKLHIEDAQTLSATVQILGATAAWRTEFVHQCLKLKLCLFNRTF